MITLENLDEWLKNVRCVRISEDAQLSENLYTFETPYNEDINRYIWEKAIEDDKANVAANYIVADTDGNLIFMFSLKCGQVFEMFMNDSMRLMVETKAGERETTDKYLSLRQKLMLERSWSEKEVDEFLSDQYSDLIQIRQIEKRQKEDSSDLLFRSMSGVPVWKTYPAIEIALFCKNKNYEGYKADKYDDIRLGQVVYDYFIYPEILKISHKTGIEYIYLFAADKEDINYKLPLYYKGRLKFQESPTLSVNRPKDADGCVFMCKKFTPITA